MKIDLAGLRRRSPAVGRNEAAGYGAVAHPTWRASAVGVYRLWPDAGFAVGALLAGVVADPAGLRAAVWVAATLTAASGLVGATRMYETHPAPGRR